MCHVSAKHFDNIRTAHQKVLLRVIGFQRRQCTDHTTLSDAKALNKTRCERIETATLKQRLFFAGAVARQNEG